MTFTFSNQEIEFINSLIAKVAVGDIRFSDVYDRVFEDISDGDIEASPTPKAGVESSVWLWFQGARHINAGQGQYSDFIRTYTNKQYEIRHGTSLPEGAMQEISDKIAEAVIKDIISTHELPTLDKLALYDASKTAESFFDGDASVWSGNLLLLALGHDASFNTNILTEGNSYNLFAMLKAASATFGELANHSFSGALELLLTERIPSLWQTLTGNNPTGPINPFSTLAATNEFLKNTYGGIAPILSLPFSTLVLGTPQDDIVQGTQDKDILHGGAGYDRLVGSKGNDLLDGGEGWVDHVDYSSFADGIIVNMYKPPKMHTSSYVGTVYKGIVAGTDALYNVSNITGSQADDHFIIHPTNEINPALHHPFGPDDIENAPSFYLEGDNGLDTIDFSLLNERINVMINGSAMEIWSGKYVIDHVSKVETYYLTRQIEKIVGTPDNDSFHFITVEDGITVDGSGGIDEVSHFYQPIRADLSNGTLTANNKTSFILHIENISASEYDDMLTGDEKDNQLIGGAGNDKLYGKQGNDKLYGGPGNDLMIGDAGNDFLEGEEGNDEIFGGVGNDYLTGSTGADTLNGGEGNDEIHGGPGNDRIIDEEGNNFLEGGDGDDEIHGGSGNDTIIGGRGNDRVSGGPSTAMDKDIFVLTPDAGSHDQIKFFNIVQDKIDLQAFPFVTYYSTNNMDTSSLNLANHIEDMYSGTQLTLGNQTIFLEGVWKQDLVASDFIFA